MSAGIQIVWVCIDQRQVFKNQTHALQCNPLPHRVIMGRAIGLKTMGERVHPGACGDEFRHANGQRGVTNHDLRHQARMPDDFFLMGGGVGQHRGRANLGPGSGCRRHRDCGVDFAGICPRPPIADILHLPHFQPVALIGHQCDHLAQIKRGTAAKADDPVVPARFEGGNPCGEVRLIRVGVNIGKHGAAKPACVKDIKRLCGNRQAGKRAVGDQQGLFDANGFAMVGQF